MKLSVIIPSYRCAYVSKTIKDILENAIGDIEVVVLLDDYWPQPSIEDDPRIVIVHKGTTGGMRHSINMGARIASGDFIMKCDDHCSFSKGFDVALIEHSNPHQISIPSRHSLDPVTWKIQRDQPVEYEFAAYPYVRLDRYRYGSGLYAKKWLGKDGLNPINMGLSEYFYMENERKAIKIDDIMIFHGSCWFMPKEHFFNIGGLEEDIFDTLYQEPQELSFKTWLSGGNVVVNKHAWYAHMHKGKNFGDEPNIRGYRLDLTAMRQTERLGTTYWMNNFHPGLKRPIKWLIEKFWPIPGWPEDWEIQKPVFEEKYLQRELQLCKDIIGRRKGDSI